MFEYLICISFEIEPSNISNRKNSLIINYTIFIALDTLPKRIVYVCVKENHFYDTYLLFIIYIINIKIFI